MTTELAGPANAALAAYARLEAVLPRVMPADLFVITRGLVGAPAALGAEADTVGHYLATVGFVEFERAVVQGGQGLGLSLSPERARRLATRKRAPRRLSELPSFAKVALAFSTPMGPSADFPGRHRGAGRGALQRARVLAGAEDEDAATKVGTDCTSMSTRMPAR